MKNKSFLKKTSTKRLFVLAFLLLIVGAVGMYGQDGGDVESTTNWANKVTEIVIGILMLAGTLFMVGHMIYIKFVRGKLYKTVFTVEYFKEYRKVNGMSIASTEEEDNTAYSLLENVFESWPIVESGIDENGETIEYRKPKKMKQINNAVALVDQAVAYAPTHEDVVTRINELVDVINSNEQREFDGSKIPMWIAAGVGVIMFFAVGWQASIYLAVGIGFYWLASQTPIFLIEKRAARSGGNIHSGCLAGVLGMIAGAQTVRTVTKWGDGSRTTNDDNSQHWIALIFGVCILAALGLLIYFWGVINYFRNYVFYI